MPPDQTYFKNIQLQWTPFIEPTADFSSSDSLITLGDTIYFTDASSQSPTNWIWDFGDGTFSTDQNPWHIYQNPGIYTIALLAENSYGMDTIIRQNYIEVLDSTQISLPWIYSVTNYQHTIQIPANSSVTIDGYQIMYGDYLSVFFDSAGTQACAGYVKYTGLNLSLTAYGDDTQTSTIGIHPTNYVLPD